MITGLLVAHRDSSQALVCVGADGTAPAAWFIDQLGQSSRLTWSEFQAFYRVTGFSASLDCWEPESLDHLPAAYLTGTFTTALAQAAYLAAFEPTLITLSAPAFTSDNDLL